MKSLYLVNNIAPHYRKGIWEVMLKHPKLKFHLCFGKQEGIGIPTANFDFLADAARRERITHLKNLYIGKEVYIWQSGVLSTVLTKSFDAIIFVSHIYCLSTWLGVFICKMRGKKVIFWGHGVYGNESYLKVWLTLQFLKLADKHLLYGARAKKIMVELGFRSDDLYVVYNSLDYNAQATVRSQAANLSRGEVFPFFKNYQKRTLIFIGRLTRVKRLDIFIEAGKFLNQNTIDYNLLIVGSGPMENDLKQLAKEGIESRWLHFYGASYSEEETGRLLYHSDLTVSPGNVGLTAIHSLTYGTPVCTHGDFSNQMPEFEAIEEDENGFFFEKDNYVQLAEKISEWFAKYGGKPKSSISAVVDHLYNPSIQRKVIERMLNNEPPLV
ncbi:MAG: glycosyltransferase [Imperialibacter sp.]